MRSTLTTTLLCASALGLLGTFSACKKAKINSLKTDVISNYADVVYATYTDAHDEAVKMQTAIYALVDNPSQATFDAAKQAWLDAREPYGQTEAFRFYAGPIDGADGPEGLLNAWPMDENYVDYVDDGAGGILETGIIFDTINYPELTEEVLVGLNENGGEKNVSTGFHAIEFLLWGQDHLDVDINPGEGGDRAFTDYSTANGYVRRGQYIKICADLIVQHLSGLQAEWAPNGAYRTTFLNMDADEALKNILVGAGVLSDFELAGERMFVVLEVNSANNPQEDEHSCFSDNTHRDIYTNVLSVRNVLQGFYVDVNGATVGDPNKSFMSMLEVADAEVYANLVASMDDAWTKTKALPTPFDKYATEENLADNGPILQCIVALQDQGKKIGAAAVVFGIAIDTSVG